MDALSAHDYVGSMAQLNVSLPAELQRHVDARAAAEGFGNPSDYLRALVQRDQDEYRADVARVQALIDEGLASGVIERDAFEVLDEIIGGIRRPHG